MGSVLGTLPYGRGSVVGLKTALKKNNPDD
jgi:hypothetical protein